MVPFYNRDTLDSKNIKNMNIQIHDSYTSRMLPHNWCKNKEYEVKKVVIVSEAVKKSSTRDQININREML